MNVLIINNENNNKTNNIYIIKIVAFNKLTNE